jgi:hypothetical protein
MNELDALSSHGFQLPSPGYLAGAFLFGLMGLCGIAQSRADQISTLALLLKVVLPC